MKDCEFSDSEVEQIALVTREDSTGRTSGASLASRADQVGETSLIFGLSTISTNDD
jgi:hypothetical protein